MAEYSINKFTFNGNTYKLLDETSGFSKVSISRKTTSGTNIADITIDGTTTQLYAPTGGGGGGTVTSVGVSNATNGGLSVSGSPVTSSGTITIGHSNVLSSAQTTSAVYPIKIDKNGHISAYGSAVTIPTVPTNVSAFTNDAGYVTTDTKNTAGSTNTSNKIYLVGAQSQAANPQTYSNSNLYYNNGLYSHATDGTNYNSRIQQTTVSTHGIIYLGSAKYDNSTHSWMEIRSDGYIDMSSIDNRLYLDSTLDATLISDIADLGWTSDVIV